MVALYVIVLAVVPGLPHANAVASDRLGVGEMPKVDLVHSVYHVPDVIQSKLLFLVA